MFSVNKGDDMFISSRSTCPLMQRSLFYQKPTGKDSPDVEMLLENQPQVTMMSFSWFFHRLAG